MPELIEQLAADCGIVVRKQSTLRLIGQWDCAILLQACKSGQALILGIEAFTLVDDKVIPEMDLIADFSSLASKQWSVACVEAARSAEFYFQTAGERENLWFEFTLQERRSTWSRLRAALTKLRDV